MTRSDTIAAISTPAGVGGIAVVRVSGTDALPCVLRHLSVATLEDRHATYCRFDDLDDVVAVYFPKGYTGEPTVEDLMSRVALRAAGHAADARR